MSDHFEEFPFEEIRSDTGDYFMTAGDAVKAGYEMSQIWSVAEYEGCYTYGPVGHFVNLLGYVATKEHHDGDTYYHEETEDEEDADVEKPSPTIAGNVICMDCRCGGKGCPGMPPGYEQRLMENW